MTNELQANLTRSNRRWRWATLALALTMTAGLLAGQAKDAKEPAQPGQPAQPKVIADPTLPRMLVTQAGAIQPSQSVEATALAIAYHALRSGGGEAKISAEAVGEYAAAMLNAMSKARK